jgi:RNA polymerase sigma-70 factor, ECF subfamily
MQYRPRTTAPAPGAGSPRISPPDFSVFYAAEVRSVVDLAFALTGDRALAEDLAQEAFAAAFRSWGRIGRYDDPAASVRRVVANRRVSAFRRGVREAKALSRLDQRPAPESSPTVPQPVAEVWAAVRQLPLRQAQVVALHYANELTLT